MSPKPDKRPGDVYWLVVEPIWNDISIDEPEKFLKEFNAAQIDGSEERSITLKMRSGPVEFTGLNYLLQFVMPNFYFHVTTSYDILRHNGVELGKLDYLGGR